MSCALPVVDSSDKAERFWTCPNFRSIGCNFFMWKDADPFPGQARLAFGILLNENDGLKKAVAHIDEKSKFGMNSWNSKLCDEEKKIN